MKNKNMLIIDCETLDTNTNSCVVLDFSYACFNTDKMISDNPYTIKSILEMKKSKLSIREQVQKYNFTVSKDTLDFWQSQSESAQKNVKPSPKDITVEQFTTDFVDYMIDSGKIDSWWSRSNSFDPPILWRLFDVVNKNKQLAQYLPHWKVRDTRTYIDAKLDFPKVNSFIPVQDEEFWKKVFVQHDSSWDILADILRMQAIMRAERDLEMITR